MEMRFTFLALALLTLPLVGCRFIPFTSSSDSSESRVESAGAEMDFSFYPPDYQLKVVEAFQAKWPADPIYNYRFELPRRAQITYSNRNGYAVRFRAQKASITTPLPEGFPWVAFFQHGKIIWVQRDSEVGGSLRWFDPVQPTVDWPPRG